MIRGAGSLAVAMEPVGTLGEKGGMLTGFTAGQAPKAAPTPDVYATQPELVRAAVAAARAQADDHVSRLATPNFARWTDNLITRVWREMTAEQGYEFFAQ